MPLQHSLLLPPALSCLAEAMLTEIGLQAQILRGTAGNRHGALSYKTCYFYFDHAVLFKYSPAYPKHATNFALLVYKCR